MSIDFCKIIIFPLDARIGKVRRTASLLYKKHGEDAELYWKQVIAANRKHLIRIGLTAEQQHEQLSGFSRAVQQELNSIATLWGGGWHNIYQFHCLRNDSLD